RDDLKTYRSKEIEELRYAVRTRPRTVILCTHRHSLRGLKQLLPPEVAVTHEVRMGLPDAPGVPPSLMRPLKKLMGETALGLGDLAVVEMKDPLANLPPLPQKGERVTEGPLSVPRGKGWEARKKRSRQDERRAASGCPHRCGRDVQVGVPGR